jgi:hypothetical protein
VAAAAAAAAAELKDGRHHGSASTLTRPRCCLPACLTGRTFDPEEADFFYVPVYSSCFIFPIFAYNDWPWWGAPRGRLLHLPLEGMTPAARPDAAAAAGGPQLCDMLERAPLQARASATAP